MLGPETATASACDADRDANHTTDHIGINGSQGASQGRTYGFEALWDLGYRAILPIAPPDAVASTNPNHKGLAGKVGKIPAKRITEGPNANHWHGFAGWPTYDTKRDDLAKWGSWGAGVGIRTGLQPDGTILLALDADIEGPVAADQFEFMLEQHLGEIPTRIGRWPKALYLVRLTEPMANTRWHFKDELGESVVEVRATAGQQFVAGGTHPKTGQPYHWPVPLCRIEDLPRVTREGIQAIQRDWFERYPETPRTWNRSASGAPGASGPYVDNPEKGFFFRISRLATSSVDRMDLWAPEAFPGATRYAGSGYRVSDECIGRGFDEDLSISIHGIADFGAETSFDAVGLLCAFPENWADDPEGAPKPTLIRAALWLADRLGVMPVDFGYDPDFAKNKQAKARSDFFGEKPSGDGPAAGADSKPASYFESFDDVAATALENCPDPLVEGILNQGDLSVLYGDSNLGKSFLALSLAFCISHGLPWAGRKTTQKRAVYIIGEGGTGFRRRIMALHKKQGSAPGFFLRMAAVNMFDGKADLPALIEQIKAVGDVGYVAIDTLARSMIGGDENSTADMSVLVHNMTTLQKATGAHVQVVHHIGKTAGKGARGSNSLRGAIDTELEITEGFVSAQKQRDLSFDKKARTPFSLDNIPLGHNAGGYAISSAVAHVGMWVAEGSQSKAATTADNVPLTKGQQITLDGLTALCGAEGNPPDGVREETVVAYFTDQKTGVAAGSVVAHLKVLKVKNRVSQPSRGMWSIKRKTGSAEDLFDEPDDQ